MVCKKCNYPHSEVVYTLNDDYKNLTSRRRQCLKCGSRFTTVEHYKDKKNQDYFWAIGK
jgi:transcriptional repressor NrdR